MIGDLAASVPCDPAEHGGKPPPPLRFVVARAELSQRCDVARGESLAELTERRPFPAPPTTVKRECGKHKHPQRENAKGRLP